MEVSGTGTTGGRKKNFLVALAGLGDPDKVQITHEIRLVGFVRSHGVSLRLSE
jgi:hypothetical protein